MEDHSHHTYNALGVVKNNSPIKLDFNDKIITNPKQLATAFNKIFKNKVKKLREKINNDPKVDPCERLESWLSQRSEPLRKFQLQPIGIQKLRKIVKKTKKIINHRKIPLYKKINQKTLYLLLLL